MQNNYTIQKKKANIASVGLNRAIVVSCRDAQGRNNALTVGYYCNCSFKPPMVMMGIVPSRFSYHMVKETKCFVINVVTKDLEDVMEYLGSKSGRDEDKLANLGLGVEDGITVNAPVLSDFPVNIECEVVDSIVTGSHEMFVGKITYIHAREDLVDEQGKLSLDKLELV